MSLIVARKHKSQIYIVGDTRLTCNNERISELQGIVKSIIINSNLCISFAGVVEYADDALRSFRKKVNCSIENTIKHFFDWHIKVNYETEFILAFRNPESKIIEIKNGESKEVINSWIGDNTAFNRFQGYNLDAFQSTPIPLNTVQMGAIELPEGCDSDQEMYSKMLKSLLLVNSDSDITCVGDFATTIACDDKGFRVLDYCQVLTHPLAFELMQPIFNIPFGTVEQGGYSLSVTGSFYMDLPIIVLFILQANLGILFISNELGTLSPIIFRNVNSKNFVTRVADEMGIEIYTMFD